MGKIDYQDISKFNFTVKDAILFFKELDLTYFSHHPKLEKQIRPKIFGSLTVYIIATTAKHRIIIKSYNKDEEILVGDYILGEAFSTFKMDIIPNDILSSKAIGIESIAFKDDLYTANSGKTYNNGTGVKLTIIIKQPENKIIELK